MMVFVVITSGAGEFTGTLCWPRSLFWLYCFNWKHTTGMYVWYYLHQFAKCR